MSNTIVITNDFYPRVTTNAKLLTDVVREFSEKHGMVVVYCSRPKYYKRRLGTGGLSEKIKIKRFWNPELQKSNVVGRVVNSFFVCAGIFVDLVFFFSKFNNTCRHHLSVSRSLCLVGLKNTQAQIYLFGDRILSRRGCSFRFLERKQFNHSTMGLV